MSSLIAFRVDASLDIGTGHVMRCLTLADTLRERGAQAMFICRQHPGHLCDLIRLRGYKLMALPAEAASQKVTTEPAHAVWLGTDWMTDAEQTRQALGPQRVDWLIVDHYALDHHWELALRPHCNKLMVIDDLADRPHDCDLLLDQNLGRLEVHYCGLLSSKPQILIGPQYALLRPEFAQWREYSLTRRIQPQLKQLLITMGGVDKDNATGQVLDGLKCCELPVDLQITVVMGPHAPWLVQVQAQAAAMPWHTQVRVGVSNMAQLMANSDLAIGAAGGTAWERCALGLPTVVLVLAENQRVGALALRNAGAVVILNEVHMLRQLLSSLSNTADLLLLGNSAARLTDGEGVDRISLRMFGSHD